MQTLATAPAWLWLLLLSSPVLGGGQLEEEELGGCDQFEECLSCLADESCVFRVVDGDARCIGQGQAGQPRPEVVAVEVKEKALCNIVHDFVQVTFDVASNSTNASATEKSVSISATTGVSNDFGLQPEEAEQQSEKSLELQKFTSESTCTEKEFDFWTLLGGILLGGCLLLFGYSALKFYQYKKKAKNYSEPYTFDTFVNP